MGSKKILFLDNNMAILWYISLLTLFSAEWAQKLKKTAKNYEN